MLLGVRDIYCKVLSLVLFQLFTQIPM